MIIQIILNYKNILYIFHIVFPVTIKNLEKKKKIYYKNYNKLIEEFISIVYIRLYAYVYLLRIR